MADSLLPGSKLSSSTLLFFTLFHLLFILIIPVECNLVNVNIDANLNLFDLFENEDLLQFRSLIQKADIADYFKSSDYPLTVFGFTDKAYFNLPPERKAVIRGFSKDDLKYFIKFFTVFNEKLSTDNIRNDGKIKSNGRNSVPIFTSVLKLNTQSDNTEQIYINGARIIRPNVNAQNGILHIIDNVMTVTSNNKAEEYLKEPDDKRVKSQEFYKMVSDYSLIKNRLSSQPRSTFFVPTDEALKNVNQEKLQQLKNDVKKLDKVISSSMVENKVMFTSFTDFRIRGHEGDDVPILYKNSFDQVSVISGESTANIVLGNITVGNGVIHMIDRLLGYEFNTVLEQIRLDSSVSKFVSFLSQININIVDRALKTDNAVTLFVPTNEAFDHIFKQTEQLKRDTKCLEKIIQFHIVPGLKWRLVVIGGEYDTREGMQSMGGSYLRVYNFDYDRYVDGAGVQAKLITADIGCTNGLIQKIDKVFGIPDLDIPSLIYNHPWLQMQPFSALRVTGLQHELTDDKTSNSHNSQAYLPKDYAQCGFQKCDYTILIPNGTAIEIMMRHNIGKEIWSNVNVLTHVLKRMIFQNQCIIMESMSDGTQNIVSSVGEPILFQKSGRSLTVGFGGRVAKILHSDLAATNGVVHIIDRVLWTNNDLEDFSNTVAHLLQPSAPLMTLSSILCFNMLSSPNFY